MSTKEGASNDPRGRLLPHIVGLGGTLRERSSTELALRLALRAAQRAGATTHLLAAHDLHLPLYVPGQVDRTSAAHRLIAELRRADGIILGSPGYHGGLSGLMKNAIDYVEDMRADPRPYFDGRSVGCIVTAAGWQGAVATLGSLRDVVHALRGWPTPLGIAINTAESPFDFDGNCTSAHLAAQIEHMSEQVVAFAARASRVAGGT